MSLRSINNKYNVIKLFENRKENREFIVIVRVRVEQGQYFFLSYLFIGGGGETRTHTPLRAPLFESGPLPIPGTPPRNQSKNSNTFCLFCKKWYINK